jgi:hypothetical protein
MEHLFDVDSANVKLQVWPPKTGPLRRSTEQSADPQGLPRKTVSTQESHSLHVSTFLGVRLMEHLFDVDSANVKLQVRPCAR